MIPECINKDSFGRRWNYGVIINPVKYCLFCKHYPYFSKYAFVKIAEDISYLIRISYKRGMPYFVIVCAIAVFLEIVYYHN